ncbi:MAG: Smr/MutS family protein [candidate division Zixibacteria bacterium]
MCKDNSPIEYPVDGTLDLHQFRPDETEDILTEYLNSCLEKGITELRIVHGKGKGVQRRIVKSFLEKHSKVIRFRHESGSGGGWGATIVDLESE